MTGRRPLARDDTLDYEVMSDEEWEEEPEGENLSVSLQQWLWSASQFGSGVICDLNGHQQIAAVHGKRI